MTAAPLALPARAWNKRLKESHELTRLLLVMADMRVEKEGSYSLDNHSTLFCCTQDSEYRMEGERFFGIDLLPTLLAPLVVHILPFLHSRFRLLQGNLRARDLRQYESGGQGHVHRHGAPVQPPLFTDVRPLPGRSSATPRRTRIPSWPTARSGRRSRQIPTPPRLSTYAHSAAIHRTTSSAVKCGARNRLKTPAQRLSRILFRPLNSFFPRHDPRN
jgi:hypothetical protein